MTISKWILAAIIHLIFSGSVTAYEGKVVGISDGDTLTALDDSKRQHKVRLAQIDAPEKNQPFGQRSKESLSRLAFQQRCRIDVVTIDKYGREVAEVTCNGTQVNREQIRLGMAWAYRQYLTDQSLLDLEAAAKQQYLGLWSDRSSIPPWEFRRGSKPTAASNLAPESSGDAFSCGSKRYCKEMRNCAEANFYLTQCGLARLDGDHDGVPCEQICR